MNKAPLTISATTVGRAQYIPDYHKREYVEKGDIPNHIAATLAFIREDLKPNEKIVVRGRQFCIVEKTAFDRFADWLAGLRQEKPVRRFRLFSYFQSPALNTEV